MPDSTPGPRAAGDNPRYRKALAEVLADRALQAQVEQAVAAYEPLPPTEPVRKRPRAWRILLFPLTVRRFERVFYCQGESFFSRWVMALKFARSTVQS